MQGACRLCHPQEMKSPPARVQKTMTFKQVDGKPKQPRRQHKKDSHDTKETQKYECRFCPESHPTATSRRVHHGTCQENPAAIARKNAREYGLEGEVGPECPWPKVRLAPRMAATDAHPEPTLWVWLGFFFSIPFLKWVKGSLGIGAADEDDCKWDQIANERSQATSTMHAHYEIPGPIFDPLAAKHQHQQHRCVACDAKLAF